MEVGTSSLPKDWTLTELGGLCEIFGRIGFRGYTVNDIVGESEGAITISPSNITNGKMNFSKCTYLSWKKYEESPEIQVQVGDILLVKTGSTVGKVATVFNLPEKATVNPQVVVLKKSKIPFGYLGYQMNFNFVQNQLSSSVVGGALPTLSQKQIAQFRIPVPPSKREQEAIANALFDIDGLVESLEKLIAKKRLIRKGAMQKLLGPKLRQSGDATHKELAFDQVFRRVNGKSYQINTSDYKSFGELPIVDQGKDYIVGYTDASEKRFHCPKEGVIIFGDHTCIVKFVDFDFVVGADGTQILTIVEGHSPLYFYYELENDGIIPTGYNRHFKDLREKKFFAPKLEVQRAIAACLFEMDKEILAIQNQLKKTRLIKQGMMQKLLTGRIRLI